MLLVVALVAAVLVPGAARADHVPDAIYTGRVEGGGKVEIRLAEGGGKVAQFLAENVPGDNCTFGASHVSDIPIEDHSFTSTRFSGSFPDSETASGTLRIRSQGCSTGTLNWSATRRDTFTLTLRSVGTGGGRVSTNEDINGLSCRDACERKYPDGKRLVLKAKANANSKFTGWSGVCSGTDECVIETNSDKTARATFIAVRQLTVFIDGTGSGRVTSSPAGIDCPTNCTHRPRKGRVVDVFASPAAGSVFTGWVGACSGTGACSVVMDSDEKLIATFDEEGGGGGGEANYRGFWNGTTAQGFDVALTVLRTSNDRIVELTLGWKKRDCEVRFENATLNPPIEIQPDGTFSETIRSGGLRVTFSGQFASDTDVSGRLDVAGQGDCKGVDKTWSATKT